MFNIKLNKDNVVSINDETLNINEIKNINGIDFKLTKFKNKTKKCNCCKTFSNKEYYIFNINSYVIYNNIFICQNCIKERLLIEDINENNFTNINILIK